MGLTTVAVWACCGEVAYIPTHAQAVLAEHLLDGPGCHSYFQLIRQTSQMLGAFSQRDIRLAVRRSACVACNAPVSRETIASDHTFRVLAPIPFK